MHKVNVFSNSIIEHYIGHHVVWCNTFVTWRFNIISMCFQHLITPYDAKFGIYYTRWPILLCVREASMRATSGQQKHVSSERWKVNNERWEITCERWSQYPSFLISLNINSTLVSYKKKSLLAWQESTEPDIIVIGSLFICKHMLKKITPLCNANSSIH